MDPGQLLSHELCYACMPWHRFSSSRTLCSALHGCQGHQGGKHRAVADLPDHEVFHKGSLAARSHPHHCRGVANCDSQVPSDLPLLLATLPCFIRITLLIAVAGDCEPVESPKTNESYWSVGSLLFVTASCKNSGFCQSRWSDVNCEGRARDEKM